MGFVDREQRHLRAFEQVQETRGEQPLGRDVQEFQSAAEEAPLDVGLRRRIETGIQERRRHAELAQRFHLVLHQCDQRRDHDRGAVAKQRGDLVAQRLAAAGRHQHQRVAAVQQVFDDGLLAVAERAVPEHVAQHRSCLCGQVRRGDDHSSSTSVTFARRINHATPRKSAKPTQRRSSMPYLDTPRVRGRWPTGMLTLPKPARFTSAGR